MIINGVNYHITNNIEKKSQDNLLTFFNQKLVKIMMDKEKNIYNLNHNTNNNEKES